MSIFRIFCRDLDVYSVRGCRVVAVHKYNNKVKFGTIANILAVIKMDDDIKVGSHI